MENKINDNWYEDFFTGINCEFWENVISPEWTKQEVDFLTNELNLKQGQSLLDILCGNGRHSIEFSKKGFRITGIDISQTFIAGLTEKINKENLNINVINANILNVNLNEKYLGAICLGNSFGYFNAEKMNLFVEKVAKSGSIQHVQLC